MTDGITMETILKRVTETVEELAQREIPAMAWKKCKGVAILNVTDVGFVLSAADGCGVVLKKNDDGTWGAPSALMFGGAGVGANFGKAEKQMIFFPMTDHGLNMLTANNKYDLGGQVGITAGKLGRGIDLGLGAGGHGVEIGFSYVFSKGVMLTAGFTNCFLSSAPEINAEFYSTTLQKKPSDIVSKPDAVKIPEGKGVEELHAKLTELAKE